MIRYASNVPSPHPANVGQLLGCNDEYVFVKNSIFNNAGLGIDLNDDGATANDSEDADAGPNGLQNKPALTSAATSSSTTVKGRLDCKPGGTFTIQFFSQPSGN